MKSDTPDHCIIGAGFSGLPIAKKLLELGETFEILERNSEVGGIWHKGVYETAHLISSKRSTQFPSYPMPERYPTFPGRQEMREYLKSYAQTFGLTNQTRFNCKVMEVRPNIKNGLHIGWLVDDQNGITRSYRTVTIASGHFWKPRKLKKITNFAGEILNSADYDSPEIFKNKKVLVIGHANSGTDIAIDAANHGLSSEISIRSGSYYFPRTFCGIPTSDLLDRSPLKINFFDRLIAKLVTSTTIGDLKLLGIPKPTKRILDEQPVVNTEFIESLRLGRIKARNEVERVEGKHVIFKNGDSSSYDLIVTAIGYDVYLPMLNKQDNFIDWQENLPILLFNLVAPKVKGLFFGGFAQSRTGGGHIFEGYGNILARMAAAERYHQESIYQKLMRLKRISFLPQIYGVKPVTPLDMRSRGLGEMKLGLFIINSALDKLGCPNAPAMTYGKEKQTVI